MRTAITKLWIFGFLMVFLSACDSSQDPSVRADLTLYVHIPYSNLNSAIENDLKEIDEAILNNTSLKHVTVVYFRPKDNYIDVMQLVKKVYKNGQVLKEVLAEYKFKDVNYTTKEGLETILHDVMSYSHTKRYGMVISSHGDGWIPVYAQLSPSRTDSPNDPIIYPSFGSGTGYFDATFSSLGQAFENLDTKWEFLLIDVCYCQNIEVLYDLRHAFHYVIGSTTEMAFEGQDFVQELPKLVSRDWSGLCDAFYKSTSTTADWNSTTISVVDCSQLDPLADIVKQIHLSPNTQAYDIQSVQVLDGYDNICNYNIFYDFSDYVHHVCSNADLIAQFDTQLNKIVLAERHTDKFNSVYFDDDSYLREIRTTCGISCSDPVVDLNTNLSSHLQQTSWFKATH